MNAYLVTRPNGRARIIEADSDLAAVAALDLPMQVRTFRDVNRVISVAHAYTTETVVTLRQIPDQEAHTMRVHALNEASWTILPSNIEWVRDAYERLVEASW